MHIKIFPTLLLVSFMLASQGQTVTGKIVLKKGDKLQSVAQTTVNMIQEMMGQQNEIKMENSLTSVTNVKDVEKEAFLLSNTITRMVTNTSAMGQDIKFDSDKPDDMYGDIGQKMKDKINVPRDIKVDKQGRIKEVMTVDSVAGGNMMENLIAGGGFIKGAPYPVFSPLPAKATKVGDSWTDSSGSVEGMKMSNTYTLKKISGNEALIDINGQMTISGQMEQQGMQFTMNMSGTTKGDALYDINTGILKKSTTISENKGSIEVMGQSIPVVMKATAETVVNKL